MNLNLFGVLVLVCCQLPDRNVIGSQQEFTEGIDYIMPEESELHEGTWLQWPHQYQYGRAYRARLDATWVAITASLVSSEKVHIIAYDEIEKSRIIQLLSSHNVPLDAIDFHIYPTDDVWVRDNGPVFVRDRNDNLLIEDWGFNGWGQKIDDQTGQPIQSAKCNIIPSRIANDQQIQVLNLNSLMINEAGSVEHDGRGTGMGCKSSILNSNRNPGMSEQQAEVIFKKYLGIVNFIWLDGQAGMDVTDQHLDGFARFANSSTIVTMSNYDLLDFGVKQSDIRKLYVAKDIDGQAYTYLIVPLTKNNVKTTYGINLGYKGSYVNFYIANNKVLVPNYNDANDAVANAIIQSIYPSRQVVGIDVRNLYANGGMIHCVTQQQPL